MFAPPQVEVCRGSKAMLGASPVILACCAGPLRPDELIPLILRNHCVNATIENKGVVTRFAPSPTGRSEEHTSELQSLMRNSYAVFCLKKTKLTTETV